MPVYGQLRERLAALSDVENASVDIELPLLRIRGGPRLPHSKDASGRTPARKPAAIPKQ